jgi:hypothetical protein
MGAERMRFYCGSKTNDIRTQNLREIDVWQL